MIGQDSLSHVPGDTFLEGRRMKAVISNSSLALGNLRIH